MTPMTPRTLALRCLAVTACAAVSVASLPAWAAAPTSTLSGRITTPSGQLPEGIVRVHAGDAKTGALYSSAPADPQGSFEIRNLPASSYRLVVEADGGLYVVETAVQLDPGRSRAVQLALKLSRAAARSNAHADARGGASAFWDSQMFAALIVVGAAILLGVLVDEATDGTETASPSSP